MKPGNLTAQKARGNFFGWRRPRSRIVASLAGIFCFWFSTVCFGQGTFKFEGQPIGTLFGGFGIYTESGMRFTVLAPGGIFLSGGSVSGYPDNGSGYLYAPDNGVWFGTTDTFPAVFDLVSFDAAERAGGGPLSLTVIGYKPMAGTVTNIFAMDGIFDGTGPLQDFQTFSLSPSFKDIFRVEIYGRFALDNVVVSGVPEPTTGSLALLGGGGAIVWSRSRRKHRHLQTHS